MQLHWLPVGCRRDNDVGARELQLHAAQGLTREQHAVEAAGGGEACLHKVVEGKCYSIAVVEGAKRACTRCRALRLRAVSHVLLREGGEPTEVQAEGERGSEMAR
jgi:hypothetical protein